MLANKEALAMLTTMRQEVLATLKWQQVVFDRMKALSPELTNNNVTVLDFIPDSVTDVNLTVMGQFIEASINKLASITE